MNTTDTVISNKSSENIYSILYCKFDHARTGLNKEIESCEICKILESLHKHDPKIICLDNHYMCGNYYFEFICCYNHKFVTCYQNSSDGCPTCKMLNMARRKVHQRTAFSVDTYKRNINKDTKLRFHCNQYKHDPACDNDDCLADNNTKCDKYILCDQDFYATFNHIKYIDSIYSCENNHKWVKKYQVITSIKIFETIYDQRFDDDIYREGIEFTGYNKLLKIAFITQCDKFPNSRVKEAEQWCNDNIVSFIYIPKLIKTSQITTSIVSQLNHLHLIKEISGDNILPYMSQLRKKMRQIREQQHKIFENRCIYQLT